VSDTVYLRAIVRQLRTRGWRPIRQVQPDPLLDDQPVHRAHEWVSRDGLSRLRWLDGTLDYISGGLTQTVCHGLDARRAGLILEAYGLMRAGVMDNPGWFGRPMFPSMQRPRLEVAR
jgi:hypothetical protein